MDVSKKCNDALWCRGGTVTGSKRRRVNAFCRRGRASSRPRRASAASGRREIVLAFLGSFVITEFAKEHISNTHTDNTTPGQTTEMPKRTYIPPPEPFRRLEIPDFVQAMFDSPEGVAFCESFRAMLPPPPSPEELAAQAVAARKALRAQHYKPLSAMLAEASREELSHAIESLPRERRQLLCELLLATASFDGAGDMEACARRLEKN